MTNNSGASVCAPVLYLRTAPHKPLRVVQPVAAGMERGRDYLAGKALAGWAKREGIATGDSDGTLYGDACATDVQRGNRLWVTEQQKKSPWQHCTTDFFIIGRVVSRV